VVAAAGCTPPLAGPFTADREPAGRAPTVERELGRGIVVVDRIPLDDASTSAEPRIDHADVCGSIPPSAIAELGLGEPNDEWAVFCQWLDRRDGHQFVNVGYDVRTVAAVARDAGTDQLSHLRWLRIDGHYAVEDISEYDPMQSCRVTADYGASESLLVVTYTGREMATAKAVDELCPKSRVVAQIVLDHLTRR
jgi:hypothetical protein